jgi:hypothetical protein
MMRILNHIRRGEKKQKVYLTNASWQHVIALWQPETPDDHQPLSYLEIDMPDSQRDQPDDPRTAAGWLDDVMGITELLHLRLHINELDVFLGWSRHLEEAIYGGCYRNLDKNIHVTLVLASPVGEPPIQSYQQIVQTFNDLVTLVRHEVNDHRPNRCNLWVTLEGVPGSVHRGAVVIDPQMQCVASPPTVAADHQRLSF